MTLLDIAGASLVCGLLFVYVGHRLIREVLSGLLDDARGQRPSDEQRVSQSLYPTERREVRRRPR